MKIFHVYTIAGAEHTILADSYQIYSASQTVSFYDPVGDPVAVFVLASLTGWEIEETEEGQEGGGL